MALRDVADGQVIVLVTMAILVLLGCVSLASDVGLLWHTRLEMQAAADAGALAGASALLGGGGGNVSNSAQAATSSNGFTSATGTANNANLVAVTVSNPPASGNYTGTSGAAEVLISQKQPTFFMSVLGTSSVQVSARAVATSGSDQNCLYTTATTGTSLLLNSGAKITSACGIVLNSSSNNALMTNSGSSLTASSIGMVGNYTGRGSISPTPTTGVVPFSDPLSSLQPPSVGNCQNPPNINGGQTVNLPPGYYCGLNINSNAKVDLSAGTYSFDGYVNVNSGATLSGSDATLYFKAGTLQANSGSTITITAPTSGLFEGIAMFQDRSNRSGLNLDSGSSSTLTGAIYVPSGSVTFNSGSYANIYSIIVASSMIVSSGANLVLNNNYSSLPDGSPLKVAILVE